MIVVGDIVSRRPQSVSVEHRAHHIAVREQDRRGTVPRLHHRRVVLIKVAFLLRDRVVVVPRLWNSDHHGKRQLHSTHHQEFQSVIQPRRIRAIGIYDRKHLVHVAHEILRSHVFFTREHLVAVAADRVDLAVMHDHAVGMRLLPAREGIGGKARVYQRDRALIIFIL